MKIGIVDVDGHHFPNYVLVQNVEDAHRRVLALRDMGITPFAQPYRDYDGGEPTEDQRRFARWVNNKAAFNACTWENYCENRRNGNGR